MYKYLEIWYKHTLQLSDRGAAAIFPQALAKVRALARQPCPHRSVSLRQAEDTFYRVLSQPQQTLRQFTSTGIGCNDWSSFWFK